MPAWVMDEDVWERAKAKVRERKDYDEQSGASFYALVDSEADARRAFLAHYDDPRFLGSVTALAMEEFERKVKDTADAPAMIKGFSAAHD